MRQIQQRLLSFFRDNIIYLSIYIPTAMVGMAWALTPGNVTPIYPAAGIAFAAYLLFGRRVIFGMFVGGLLVNLISIGDGATPSVANVLSAAQIGVGEVLASVIAARILQRYTKIDYALTRTKGVITTFAVSALWVISPTIGVLGLAWHQLITWQEFPALWLTWWLGDALGVMLVMPLAVIMMKSHMREFIFKQISSKSFIPTICYVGFVMIIALLSLPIAYLIIPATMLLVSRYNNWGAIVASTIPPVIFIPLMLADIGYFAQFEIHFALLYLQLLLAVNIFVAYYLATVQVENNQLRRRVHTVEITADLDHLTSCLNRRGFYKHARKLLGERSNLAKASTLVLIDLDNFKQVNDKLGHDVGDIVLQRFANLLRRHVRDNDVVSRFGGEEFVIVFAIAQPDVANIAVTGLLEKVSQINYRDIGLPQALTCSMGVVSIQHFDELDDKLQTADKLLYKAKHAGKAMAMWDDHFQCSKMGISAAKRGAK